MGQFNYEAIQYRNETKNSMDNCLRENSGYRPLLVPNATFVWENKIKQNNIYLNKINWHNKRKGDRDKQDRNVYCLPFYVINLETFQKVCTLSEKELPFQGAEVKVKEFIPSLIQACTQVLPKLMHCLPGRAHHNLYIYACPTVPPPAPPPPSSPGVGGGGGNYTSEPKYTTSSYTHMQQSTRVWCERVWHIELLSPA